MPVVAGYRFRGGLGYFPFFALGVGGNAGSFLDVDDATGQFNETLPPLIRGVGALFAGQYSVQPEGINDPHQGIQLADQVCKLGNLGRVDLDGVFGRVV